MTSQSRRFEIGRALIDSITSPTASRLAAGSRESTHATTTPASAPVARDSAGVNGRTWEALGDQLVGHYRRAIAGRAARPQPAGRRERVRERADRGRAA